MEKEEKKKETWERRTRKKKRKFFKLSYTYIIRASKIPLED